MGFATTPEKHYVSNGNINAKRMMNNIVHSFNSFNFSMNTNTNTLLNHFRSWQRSRKMKIFNNSKNNHPSSIIGHLSPMNNLCYQSVSINDFDHHCYQYPNNDYLNSVKSTACSKSSVPIVSFKNKGDGKIALNLDHEAIVNDNQLYSMNILPTYYSIDDRNRIRNFNSTHYAPLSKESTMDNSNDNSLENEPWYYGQIDRENAIKLIQNCPTGSFVVRNSFSNEGCYALTVRVPYDFNHNGISHYLILQTDEDKFKIKVIYLMFNIPILIKNKSFRAFKRNFKHYLH